MSQIMARSSEKECTQCYFLFYKCSDGTGMLDPDAWLEICWYESSVSTVVTKNDKKQHVKCGKHAMGGRRTDMSHCLCSRC